MRRPACLARVTGAAIALLLAACFGAGEADAPMPRIVGEAIEVGRVLHRNEAALDDDSLGLYRGRYALLPPADRRTSARTSARRRDPPARRPTRTARRSDAAAAVEPERVHRLIAAHNDGVVV